MLDSKAKYTLKGLGTGAKEIVISKVAQENERSGDEKWWKSQFWGRLQP